MALTIVHSTCSRRKCRREFKFTEFTAHTVSICLTRLANFIRAGNFFLLSDEFFLFWFERLWSCVCFKRCGVRRWYVCDSWWCCCGRSSIAFLNTVFVLIVRAGGVQPLLKVVLRTSTHVAHDALTGTTTLTSWTSAHVMFILLQLFSRYANYSQQVISPREDK